MPEIQLPRTFAALRHRNFRLFWAGQLISLIGTWMQSIAQSWLVLDITKSPFMLGLVSAIGTLPVLLFALPAGAICDRVNKRHLLIVTQTVMMVLAFILWGLAAAHIVRVWHILILAALLGVSNAFDMPGRQSFVVEMVSREDLYNAIALNSTMFNSARIVGPAIAGILIGTIGVAGCFLLNGVSFIAVIIGLFLMKHDYQPNPSLSDSIFKDLIEGLRYIRNHRIILTIIGIIGIFSIFGMPYTVLMPVFAQSVLNAGARGYGLLMTCTGVGAVVSALALATFSNLKHRGRLILAASVIFIATISLFAASRSFVLSAILLVFIGFAMVAQTATANTMLQMHSPDDLRGRVMSVYGVMFMGFAPIGSFQAGVIAQHFGAPVALVIGSAVMALTVALILILRPEIRNL
jgi:MFS family permease